MITYTYEDPFTGKNTEKFESAEDLIAAHPIFYSLFSVYRRGKVELTLNLPDEPAIITIRVPATIMEGESFDEE